MKTHKKVNKALKLVYVFTIVSCFSLVIDYLIIDYPINNWFQRSGSLLLLSFAYLQYSIASTISKSNELKKKKNISLGETRMLFNIPPELKFHQKATIIGIVISTVICGYGDLIV